MLHSNFDNLALDSQVYELRIRGLKIKWAKLLVEHARLRLELMRLKKESQP
ncbi:hypothetical protein J7E49_21525 [Variovorax paradoxus]|nr:hypothetical protein [Variovorax paradoxus]